MAFTAPEVVDARGHTWLRGEDGFYTPADPAYRAPEISPERRLKIEQALMGRARQVARSIRHRARLQRFKFFCLARFYECQAALLRLIARL